MRRSDLFRGPSNAHDREHCLEVELPFLQTVAPDARLVPVLVGQSTDRRMARQMAQVIAGLLNPTTVVVVSTDFSHHGESFSWAPYPVDAAIAGKLVDLAKMTEDMLEKLGKRHAEGKLYG